MNYSKSITMKVLRTTHKIVIRRGMTRGDIGTALGNIPTSVLLTDIVENDELGTVRLEFLEEKEDGTVSP